MKSSTTKLDRFLQLYQSEESPETIMKYHCSKVIGLTKKCLLESNAGGLKNCIKCWNQEWDGTFDIKEGGVF